jgi:HTH-type transcriptional regulator, glycine betaine synthesis regulator
MEDEAHNQSDVEWKLEETELLLVETCVRLADSLGIPKSLAQVYALVFISPQPISAQDCVNCLRISRSSAGQALKILKEVSAIRTEFQLGARREVFVIEPDLGNLIRGILEGRLFPAFEAFFTQLDQIERRASSQDERFLRERITKLRRWSGKIQDARFLFSS